MRAYHVPFVKTVNPAKIQRRAVKNAKPTVLQNPASSSLGELSELVEQLEWCRSLRESDDLRDLAQKALVSLKNRQNENIEDWAAKLTDDVAGAID